MKALIDGDIVAYRAACAVETIPTLVELAAMGLDIDDRERLITVEPVGFALSNVNNIINVMLEELNTKDYQVYISGEHDFRYLVNPDYKANRKDSRRPAHLQACREHMVTQWGAIVTEGIEADDALGIAQTDKTIICSIDKDLLQIPGQHYNFVKKEFKMVTKEEAEKFLWKQMLIGDTSDNILGISGIGKVKADKIIDPINDPEEMYNVVYNLYNDHERFEMNLKCLTILMEEPDW